MKVTASAAALYKAAHDISFFEVREEVYRIYRQTTDRSSNGVYIDLYLDDYTAERLITQLTVQKLEGTTP